MATGVSGFCYYMSLLLIGQENKQGMLMSDSQSPLSPKGYSAAAPSRFKRYT